jgi:hypothetical protein
MEKEVIKKIELTELEKAKQVIDNERQLRGKQCFEKIESILKEFNCQIITDVEVVLNGEIVVPSIKAL